MDILVSVCEIRNFFPFLLDLKYDRLGTGESQYSGSQTLRLTADGVKDASVLNTAPLLRSHRTSATKPAPSSKILPFTLGPSGCVTAATNGATHSG